MENYSPGYLVWQRFVKNKLALGAVVIIIMAHIIALLGYLIMPDSTPNADDGSPSIKKQGIGFEVNLIKFIKQRHIPTVGVFSKMLYGQESTYIIEPVEKFKIVGDSVFYTVWNSETPSKKHLLPIVRQVHPSLLFKLRSGSHAFINVKGVYHYHDLAGHLKMVSLAQLKKEFLEKNIERRKYLLGTDSSGRDMLSRLLFGARVSLMIGMIAMVISMLLGVTLGAVAGYFGGFIDKIIVWVITVTWSIPGIMLVIAISLALQSKGIWVAFVAVGLTMWVEVARVVRGEFLAMKEKQFIEAAKSLGLKDSRIIFRHMIPNIVGALVVIATANYASAVLIEAGLSFLGLGVQAPMPSWGMMVNEGFNSDFEGKGAYLILLPSLCISVIVLSFNLVGNALRDAYDPVTKKQW